MYCKVSQPCWETWNIMYTYMYMYMYMNNHVHSALQKYRKKEDREERKSTHYKQNKIYNSHNGLEKHIHVHACFRDEVYM